MSNGIDITVKITPTFEELGNKFKNVNLRPAFQEVIQTFAFGIERFSKIASPVDTGRMRASIMTSLGNLEAKVAPHVDYAIYVHEGTKYMKGQPFMSIGLNEAEVTYFKNRNIMSEAIEKSLGIQLK